MNRFVASLVLPAFLLACGSGSNPFEADPQPPAEEDTGGDPPGDEENPLTDAGIPSSLARDLARLEFDPATQTLTVEGVSLDEVPFIATYRRRPAFDRGGYQAFTAQDDPLDRHNTAFAREAANGSDTRAGVTISPNPRNRYFGGGYYERDGEFTPPVVSPSSGLVSYSGSYVGLVNIGFRDDGPGSLDDLAPVPAGTANELRPGQAGIVDASIFINADFADNVVEGNIYNRRLINPSTGLIAQTSGGRPLILPSIVLIGTPINDDGTFIGEVEYDQTDALITTSVIGIDIGDYGGIFGGTDASAVAGNVYLEQFDGPGDIYGLSGEEEVGVFVLDQCGQPVEDTVGCASTNP
ncbi:thymidylate synthase [Roseovarius aestuariivivens]|uniref:thymidylate synthase n=1 Tax=Roseovarius aestuariivivens TaxID=1888910 RepID=UPI0010818391|nr:thymidylate synthase [Roseovarius aestuariivivens]